MKLQYLAPLAAFTLATPAAFADGFYGVGQITHSSTSLDGSHFDSALSANGATGLSSSSAGNGTQWRLQGGYRFNPNLAVELGYIDFGKATYNAGYASGSAQGSVKAGGLDAAALLILPLNHGFSVFGKAGLVAANVKSDLSAGAPASAAGGNSSANVVRPLIGAGLAYKLTENVDLRADFDHVDGLGQSDKTGKIGANMFSLGAAYNF